MDFDVLHECPDHSIKVVFFWPKMISFAVDQMQELPQKNIF